MYTLTFIRKFLIERRRGKNLNDSDLSLEVYDCQYFRQYVLLSIIAMPNRQLLF